MQPISTIAGAIGINESELIPYGRFKAKLDRLTFDEKKVGKCKLILVTSITPTKSGNGKTTTSIGIADGLRRIGKNAVLALREPSLGPVFGMKGGATGGGLSQVVPAEDINLHFNGDFHAITSANNTLSALLDNYNYFNKGTSNELKEVLWKRVQDVNDRSLRYVITGLNGSKNGIPSETGFDITPASELMAILCLSRDHADLRERIDRILLGFRGDGSALTVKDLGVSGSIMALLKDALVPNLVQTLEGTPAFIHGGPFANIAHGCNSIMATKAAMHYGDYAVTEAGFGSDLGAEKFLDIKARVAGISPALSVLVVTLQSFRLHGGVKNADLKKPDLEAVKKGLKNLERHIDNLTSFGQKVLVAMNRFDTDPQDEIDYLQQWCDDRAVAFSINEAYAKGGAGAVSMAEKIVELTAAEPPAVHHVYSMEDDIKSKIEKVVRRVYGGEGVVLSKKALKNLKRIDSMGLGNLPVCIAKTQYSFTDKPEAVRVYDGFTITVDDLVINAGAGFIVAVCGEMVRMPGLPEQPSAYNIDVVDGKIVGLS
ncbi:MAG: formate--tetrahydrofolate ligase [Bacteroidota bacterium]